MEKTELLIMSISLFSRSDLPARAPERPPRRSGTSDGEVRTGGEPHALACDRPGRSPSSRAAARDRPSMTGSVHRESGLPRGMIDLGTGVACGNAPVRLNV